MNTNSKNTLAALLLLAVLLGQFFATPQTAAAAACDAALFIADVTVPDGTIFPPNTAFTKTWRLKNVGTCTWTTSYKLIFFNGAQMGGAMEIPLLSTVAPNATVDLSANLTAPAADGSYRGNWQLRNAANTNFGVGATANRSFWVDIVVRNGNITFTPLPPSGMSDDFASSGGVASWQSGAGKLPFPGKDQDPRGFAIKLDIARLETGATFTGPTLLMVPQNKTDGYIQGVYPAQTIRNGDHFQSTIGCQFESPTSCSVTYRIDYRTSAGTKTLWTFKEKYDGHAYNVNLDLSFLAGKNVEFFLLVLASGSPSGDRALWVAPRISHAGVIPPTHTPTQTVGASRTPTPTLTPSSNWLTYTNQQYQFQFRYPSEGQISNQTETARIALPIVPGTNLGQKYLDVSVAENATICTSPLTSGYVPGSFTSTPVSINGIPFIKESGADAGAGNLWQWTAYSTLKGSTCISLGFVLHSTNPGNYQTPPPVFDQNAESTVFEAIMVTFTWLGSPPTPTVTMTPPPSVGCDRATFIADVTVPDGTIFAPNTTFTKTWQFKNTGACDWTTAYKLVFVSGEQMGGPAEVNLPSTVAPNATVDLSVNLTAPGTNGTYRGYWQLKNAAGGLFGIGPTADKPSWVEIVVSTGNATAIPVTPATPAPTGDDYNFATNGGSARWQSGVGALTFPGADGDARGFAIKLDSVQLETGATVNQPTLLMAPQRKTDGYIQGLYPAQMIRTGDRFQATIGCQYGATSCYVTYRIDVRTSAGTRTLWTFKERYEGKMYNVNLDLSSLAGKSAEFFLLVLASGSPTGDRALWVAPRIVHAAPPSPTPTATPRIATATIEVDQPVIGVCGRPNPVNVVATVTTIAATTVTYHWELVADKTVITPDESLTFNAAGTQTVSPAGYSADCGVNYLARIIITSPSYWSAAIYYSVVEPASTPSPTPTPTVTPTVTPTSMPITLPIYDFNTFQVIGGMSCSEVANYVWNAETCNGESGGCQVSQTPLFGKDHAGFLRYEGNTICGLNLP